MEQKIAQVAIVLNKTKTHILVSRFLTSKHLPQKLTNKLCLPGGQIEPADNPDESIIKEIFSETGILIEVGLPFYIWNWTYNKAGVPKQIIGVARLAHYLSGKIRNPSIESETSLDKARWIKLVDLPISEFVFDEQPILSLFKQYQEINPFKL